MTFQTPFAGTKNQDLSAVDSFGLYNGGQQRERGQSSAVTLQGSTPVTVPLSIVTPPVTTATAGNTGTYPLAITATAGSITHVVYPTLIVKPASDFTLSASPAELTVPANGTASFTITATGLNGYSGPVTLGTASAGCPACGVSNTNNCVSVASISGSLSTTSSVTYGLQGNGCNAQNASYSTFFQINANVGQVGHNVCVIALVTPNADYTVTSAPQGSTSISSGGSVTYTISVAGAQGFTYPLTLSLSGLPTGATASWQNGQYTFTADGSTSLTITSTSATPPGGYTVQLVGPSQAANNSNHAATLPFTIVSPQDFTLQPEPGTRYIGPSTTTTYTILVVGGSGFTGNVNLSVATPPAGMTATISPSAVAAGGQATLSVTTGAAPPLGSWTLNVTGASGSLNHTAQLYAIVDGPEPSTIIGPVPGAILNGGSNLFTWNLGAGVSQYALQVGSTPGGYNYANITGNAQSLRQAPGVLGAQVYLPSTLGQTIYATLTSTIGVVQQSQSYTYTIGNRSQLSRPTGPTIVTPPPTLYTNFQPVDFTYTFQSGSPQLLSPIVQTGDPTLYGQIISVTPTTATVRYRATAAAPGTSQGSLALSAQISRPGATVDRQAPS